jgi:hypothetical protein
MRELKELETWNEPMRNSDPLLRASAILAKGQFGLRFNSHGLSHG